MKPLPKIIIILGPTSTGKSELAVEVARRFRGEVISADSRQVYRGLDIGSGKITKREMRGIPHHLLDVANPRRQFSVAQWHRLAERAIADIAKRGKVPIICGGTGFYIQSITSDTALPAVSPNQLLRKKLAKKSTGELLKILTRLDPRRAREIDTHNPVRLIRAIEIATALGAVPLVKTSRPRYHILQIGLTLPRDVLKKKISARVALRLRRGMIAEAQQLHQDGLSLKRMRALGLDYRALADLLSGTISRSELGERLAVENYRYAKRQMTWFQRDKNITWFSPKHRNDVYVAVKDFLNKSPRSVIYSGE